MNIELIPVLNIEWSSDLIERPTQWPYWENSEIWESFYEKCQSEKGYSAIKNFIGEWKIAEELPYQ